MKRQRSGKQVNAPDMSTGPDIYQTKQKKSELSFLGVLPRRGALLQQKRRKKNCKKNLPVKLKGWNFKGYYIIEYFSLWHKENATLFNLWKF